MRKDDPVLQLLALAEHPERYEESAIQAWLDDDSHSDDYEWMSRIAGAFAIHGRDTDTPSARDAVWQRLERQHRAKRRRFRRWQAAATVAGLIGLSGLAFAAIKSGWLQSEESTGPTVSEVTAGPATAETPESHVPQTKGSVRFENQPLDEVLSTIAAAYHYDLQFKNAASKSVRLYYEWNKDDDIETVVSDLNHFKRFHLSIDHHTLLVE